MSDEDDEPVFVFDPERAILAVKMAGEAVAGRLVDLESTHGSLTLVFVTDVEAKEILSALQERPDTAVRRVLVAMYEAILAQDAEPDGEITDLEER